MQRRRAAGTVESYHSGLHAVVAMAGSARALLPQYEESELPPLPAPSCAPPEGKAAEGKEGRDIVDDKEGLDTPRAPATFLVCLFVVLLHRGRQLWRSSPMGSSLTRRGRLAMSTM